MIAVFFPLTMVSGMSGVLFKQLGWMMCHHVYFYRRGTVVDTDALFSVASFAEETIENVQTLFHPIEKALDGLILGMRKDVELGSSSSSGCDCGMYCFLHCQLCCVQRNR